MMLSTIPATVEGFTKLCDCLGAEISIIRTKKWVPDQIAFLTRVFSLILSASNLTLNGEATMTTQVAGYTYGTNDAVHP